MADNDDFEAGGNANDELIRTATGYYVRKDEFEELSSKDIPKSSPGSNPDDYKLGIKNLIESEVKGLFNEELKKAKQQLVTEQRKAIGQLVEENKSLIEELVKEQKKAIWDEVDTLKKSLLHHFSEDLHK